MAQKPESRLIDKTLPMLREHGAWVFKVHGNPYQPKVIDIVGCMSGVFFGLEAKVGKNKPTDHQSLTMQMIREAGGITGVFRTPEEALEIIERGVMGLYAVSD